MHQRLHSRLQCDLTARLQQQQRGLTWRPFRDQTPSRRYRPVTFTLNPSHVENMWTYKSRLLASCYCNNSSCSSFTEVTRPAQTCYDNPAIGICSINQAAALWMLLLWINNAELKQHDTSWAGKSSLHRHTCRKKTKIALIFLFACIYLCTRRFSSQIHLQNKYIMAVMNMPRSYFTEITNNRTFHLLQDRQTGSRWAPVHPSIKEES